MDIKLEKKPWYIRYRYYLIGGLLFAAFLIYVIVLSLGPRKLRIDAENIQIAEVKEDNFIMPPRRPFLLADNCSILRIYPKSIPDHR